jgi:hypothetical protein
MLKHRAAFDQPRSPDAALGMCMCERRLADQASFLLCEKGTCVMENEPDLEGQAQGNPGQVNPDQGQGKPGQNPGESNPRRDKPEEENPEEDNPGQGNPDEEIPNQDNPAEDVPGQDNPGRRGEPARV